MKDTQRKLASIARIESVKDIEGADFIQAYQVKGWWVVDKKDSHRVGDLAVYIEADAWVPYELAPFLSKDKEPKEFNGVKGERLRTIKLRKQISQGLLLPYATMKRIAYEGEDITEELGIQKWEMPIPSQLVGQAKGYFPSFIPKTDQERIQNCFDEVKAHDEPFEVTLKLDGSSCTVYHKEGEVGVCSRNLELKINEENKDNTFIKVATASGLLDRLLSIGYNVAVQGELMGPNIQSNRENLQEHCLYIFDVFDIDKQEYLLPKERHEFLERLLSTGVDKDKVKIIPVIEKEKYVSDFNSVDDFLLYAEGESMFNKIREGVVFKSHASGFSFKSINNKYLLKFDL